MHVVTMEEVLSAFDGKTTLPENAVLLTFDDGYIDNYLTAFPLLKKHHMQGSFFIPGRTFTENVVLDVNKIHFILAVADTDKLVEAVKRELAYYRSDYPSLPSTEELWKTYAKAGRFDDERVIFVKRILQTAVPEKLRHTIADDLFREYVNVPEDAFSRELYMNRDQIRVMRENGMFIGCHGYNHYWLGNLTEAEMEQDIEKGLETISEFIDPDSWVMNYPYGSYNEDTINYVTGRGCKLAVTTEVEVANVSENNRYTVPRLDCNDFPPKSENYKEM